MKQPNEVLFYIGTYNVKEERAIALGALDPATGEMRLLGGTGGIENPSFLALNRAGSVLYAVSEQEDGEIHTFAVEAGSKVLHPLGSVHKTEGGAPCYVSLSKEEDQLYIANYMGGNVNLFPVREDGSLGEMASQVRHEGSGPRQDRQEGPHPHSVIPGDGEVALVCDLGLDQVIIYKTADGKLTKMGEVALSPGSGPRHLAVHASGQWIYLINELSSTITVFAANPGAGELRIVQEVSALPPHYAAGSDDTAADIHLSPCGRFLYASNRGHDSIAMFTVDAGTGQLAGGDWVSSGGRTPRNFAIIGGMLLAANQNSDNIVSFRIDAESGRLIPTGNELEVKAPVCLVAL